MSQHSKETSINPKALIYIVAIIAVALIVILAIVLIVKNKDNNNSTPSNNMLQSNSTAQQGSSSGENSSTVSPNPQIRGVENGKIYYTTQHIIVSDDNLKSVTVNGDDFNTDFFIEGNAENMYVIEATDDDGNTTTYIVYTKAIKSIAEEINSLSIYTVTTDNLENLQLIQENILNTGTKYSPPEESAELDNILKVCEKLLNRIGEVKENVDRLTNDYKNPEYLASVEKNTPKLAALIDDIEGLLATNNLTSEQRTQLTTIRGKYSSYLSAATSFEQLS